MKKITIGRNADNDIVLPYSQVSGNHAELIINDDGVFTLVDHSTNGSSVNGRRIHHQSVNVRKGDSILFANQAAFDWASVFQNSTMMINNNMNSTNRIGNNYSPYEQPSRQTKNFSSIDPAAIERFLTINSAFFPNDKVFLIKEKLQAISENIFYTVQNFTYKDPSAMLLISVFFGGIGVDRFMLGDLVFGALKFVTGGGFGFLWLMDIINIRTMTKEYNFKKIMELTI